jgi:hypothetical protein
MMSSYTWKSIVLSSLVLACFLVASQLSEPAKGDGPSSFEGKQPGAANPAELKASWAPDQGLVVHEWGTFTTFSGSDGVFLEFRPLADQISDLPGFVWNRLTRTNNPKWFKGNMRAKVRMETPVLYFYANETQDIEVKVDFPDGLLTEFYPPVQCMVPELDRDAALGDGEWIGNSSLDWGRVTLLPIHQLAPQCLDPERRNQITSMMERELVPHAEDDAHYAKARDTDSALVFVHAQDKAKEIQVESEHKGFAEKFLFYRGVGKFDLPIQATFDASQHPVLVNQGSQGVPSAIMLRVVDQQIEASQVFQVAAGKKQSIPAMQGTTKPDVMKTIEEMLRAEGLYDKEAAAMVATWEDSWLMEEGTRVLYIVPQAITDDLLPLHLNPLPAQLVRTLVGRLEILSPDDEEQAMLAVQASFAKRIQLAQAEELPIPPSILKFGRMAEPTLARVAALSRSQQIRGEAEYLIARLRQQSNDKQP